MLCYMGHVLTDNRHGLVLNAQVTLATAPPSEAARRRCLPMLRELHQAASRSVRIRTTTLPASIQLLRELRQAAYDSKRRTFRRLSGR